MRRSRPEPKSFYPSDEEWREVESIAEREERAKAKIVQFAVRAFSALYQKDRQQAMSLAQQEILK